MGIDDVFNDYQERTREYYGRKADEQVDRLKTKVNNKMSKHEEKQVKKINRKTEGIERRLNPEHDEEGLLARIGKGAAKLAFVVAVGSGLGYMGADRIPINTYEVQPGDGIYRIAEELGVSYESVENALLESRGENTYFHPGDEVKESLTGRVRLYD